MPSLSATRFKLLVADSHGEAKVSLRSCAKGVGLFANRDIAAGTLVAYAPATVSCPAVAQPSPLAAASDSALTRPPVLDAVVLSYYPIEVIHEPGADTRDPLHDYYIEVKHSNGHAAEQFVGRCFARSPALQGSYLLSPSAAGRPRSRWLRHAAGVCGVSATAGVVERLRCWAIVQWIARDDRQVRI